MEPSPAIRLALVGLLPAIGLAVYLEGQSYDPALIRFSPPGAEAAGPSAFLPEKAGDFSRAGEARIFTAENLYEYVNGHAEYFISAGFHGLAVGEYLLQDADPDEPGVIVDIYDMGKGIQAFGVFTDEVGDSSAEAPFGDKGSSTPQGLSFIKGKYYVKIASFEESAPIRTIAARIDELIDPAPGSDRAFSGFPDLGPVEGTRFVRESYRGMEFAGDVVERKYRLEGKTVYLALSRGEAAAMKKLAESYLEFFRESEVEFEPVERGGRSLYRVIDPYEGDWYLVPGPDSVLGVYGEVDEAVLDLVLKGSAKGEGGEGE